MNILLVNDDGIDAVGIKILANELSRKHRVVVIAPNSERSAAGHSYTFTNPITLKRLNNPEYHCEFLYETSGTPCDCVVLGLNNLDVVFDFVIAGINSGANIGTDILASGTVNAALEGVMHGIPSLAVSQEIPGLVADCDYSSLYKNDAEFIGDFISGEYIEYLHGQYAVSIDFPFCNKEEIRGVRSCQMGISKNDFYYHAQKDFVNRTHYWVDTERTFKQYNYDNKTDDFWIDNKYIVITPVKYDMTDYSALNDFKLFFDKDF